MSEQFFYNVCPDFLLPTKGDSFLRIQIFTEILRNLITKLGIQQQKITNFTDLLRENVFMRENHAFKNHHPSERSYFDSQSQILLNFDRIIAFLSGGKGANLKNSIQMIGQFIQI